jgi:hypothetical protein
MREGDRIVRLRSRAPGNTRGLSVVAMPWRDPRGWAPRRQRTLLACQFVRAAPIEATVHVAGVAENAVIRRVGLFPAPAVYRDAAASYGRAVPHARAIDAGFL